MNVLGLLIRDRSISVTGLARTLRRRRESVHAWIAGRSKPSGGDAVALETIFALPLDELLAEVEVDYTPSETDAIATLRLRREETENAKD